MIATNNDVCLNIFDAAAEASKFTMPQGGSVLEIGCAEADWLSPMHAARPDLVLTGIDWRHCAGRAGTVIKADVLVHDFPPFSFDAVVLVSTLEHIGLGHYEDDPKDPDGDTKTMQRIWGWLKPGGQVLFDVPWDPKGYHVIGSECRVYDDDTIWSRLSANYRPQWAGYFGNSGVLLPSRPSHIDAARFYYVAHLWQKV